MSVRNPVLLCDSRPDMTYIIRALNSTCDIKPIVLDSHINKPIKSMNDKTLLAMAMMAMAGGNMGLPGNETNFNLRRDNDEGALASANAKIALAREKARLEREAKRATPR